MAWRTTLKAGHEIRIETADGDILIWIGPKPAVRKVELLVKAPKSIKLCNPTEQTQTQESCNGRDST